MKISSPEPDLAALIGARVRELRSARRLTQAHLARELRVTQGRLSALERGKASFTAEQFLTILRIFNVPASEFDPSTGSSLESELQNAVARLGARHLFEDDQIVPSERFREAHAAVREVLADATSPRLLTGLAPVLVEHVDTINLAKLALELSQVGLERRLYWLAENVRQAVRRALSDEPPPARARTLRRAALALGRFLARGAARSRKPAEVDLLDKSARSEETVRELHAEASRISKRWNVATALQVDDFYEALRQAHASV